MGFHLQASRTSLYPMTKYLFFNRIIFLAESKDKRKAEFHRKWFSICCLGRLTIQNHIILQRSTLIKNYFMQNYILRF